MDEGSEEQDGSQTERSRTGVALLIIDLINDMAFDSGEDLRRHTESTVDALLALRDEADSLDVPVIYVNDNGGHWRSNPSTIVENCTNDRSPAREIVRRIAPRAQDYFVIKPHLSGFYATSLPVLLPKLGVNRLVLAGVATDICVLFTAADAHMRDYDLWIPRDVVAAEHDDRTTWALEIMQKSMDAETRPSGELALKEWAERDPARSPSLVAERS